MASIDVISMIFESFELIRAHYREVAFPLFAILLLSGAGNLGGSSFSDLFTYRASGADASSLASAMQSPELFSAGLAGALLAVMAAMVAFLFFYTAIEHTLWFYVSEHFYALLRKKKVSKDWKARMKRFLPKALLIALFEFLLLAALLLSLFGIILSFEALGWVGFLVALAILVIVVLNVGFYIIPLWMYYALDGVPFFESLSRSVRLVYANVMHFAIFCIIFFLLGAGAIFAGLYACCFSFLVTPLLMVFMGLLSRVTLLKMKLAAEKKS